MYRVIEAVSSRKLTTIDRPALCELAQTAMDIEFDGLDGDFLQAGCGFGGAAIVIAHAKRRARILTVHDPFAGGPDVETQARRELAAQSADERLNVRLIAGLYAETVAMDGPLSLAHVDCGKYEPMRLLLERLGPRLVAGGQIIIDDYRNKEECQRAVDEYFRKKSGFRLERKSRLHVIRN